METKHVCAVLALAFGPVMAVWAYGQQVDKLQAKVSFTPRTVSRMGDDLFIVAQPLTVNLSAGTPPIIVPIGFATDLASIPKQLHWWEGKVDRSMAPAVVHDYLYWYQTCSREEADAVMLVTMRGMQVGNVKASAIFEAVRSLGGNAFEDNGRRRMEGEVRTLTGDYFGKLLISSVEANATLTSFLAKAKAASGLVAKEVAAPGVKNTCAVAMKLL